MTELETGFFITLEGGEGSGKTTQINRLSSTLAAKGYQFITTREPGGTPEAEQIRNLLVQRDGGNWNAMAEVLLLFAARVMHVEQVIKPALESGKIVICDRFTDSTLAYQGYGHAMDMAKINEINTTALGGFKPDLTIILDVDAQSGLERSTKRLAGQKGYSQTEDRFERMEISFHEKLRAGFLEIAKSDPQRCTVINADQEINLIEEEITNTVLKALPNNV